MIGPDRHHRQAIAEYVHIAAQALSRDRVAKPPIMGPPPEAGSTFWLSETEVTKRQVLYAIRLAQLVALRYELPFDGCGDVHFVDLNGPAGRVTTQGASYYIEIDQKYRGDPTAVLAILAHEFAHVFLTRRGVRVPNDQQNEELTDVVAALAGFGSILKAACKRESYQHRVFVTVVTTHRIGYLNRDDISWLSGIQARISYKQPFRVWSTADPEARGYSPCPACGSRLRLPYQSARVLITCPVCGLVQDILVAPGVRRQPRSFSKRLLEFGLTRLDAYNGVPET
jgi:hypothetical protein